MPPDVDLPPPPPQVLPPDLGIPISLLDVERYQTAADPKDRPPLDPEDRALLGVRGRGRGVHRGAAHTHMCLPACCQE